MSLTLACACGSTPITWNLTGMTASATTRVTKLASSGYICSLFVGVPAGTSIFNVAAAPLGEVSYSIDLTSSLSYFVTNWGSIVATMGIDQTTLQALDAGEAFSASWLIKLIYTVAATAWDSLTTYAAGDLVSYAGNSYYSLSSGNVGNLPTNATYWKLVAQQYTVIATDSGSDQASCINGGVVWSTCSGGQGSGLCQEFESAPLAPCNGSSITVGSFAPAPQTSISSLLYGSFCLCASGGAAPYSYSMVGGRLPTGLSFSDSTGCVTGDPDYVEDGTDQITFSVIDSLGAVAMVTCQTALICPSTPQLTMGNTFV